MLTAASVMRIKPPESGQVEYFDQGFPGLALRVSYGGGKSWVFFYRHAGKLRRMTLGTYPALGLAEARQAWRDARTESAQGRDPARSRKVGKPATDFESVAREWLQRDQAKNRTVRQVTLVVEGEMLPLWGHRPIADIGRRDVLDLIDSIADRGAVTMARRVQGYVHRLFRWAVGRGIVEKNPAADLPRPGAETRRERVLTDTEITSIWKAADEWPFGAIYRLLLLTGARRGEIGDLRWAELDKEEIKLDGARTKNGKPHVIPLSKAAQAVTSELHRVAGTELVFGISKSAGGYDRAKERVDAKIAAMMGAQLPPWRLHDLRRTVATGLQKLGMNLQVIEAVLGHVSGSRSGVVGTYQRHSFDAEKRAALEAWGAHVSALVE
jgi:integrase